MSHHLSTTSHHPSTTTGCATVPALFQDPLLEEPPASTAPADVIRRYAGLQRAAEQLCQACPLLQPCLFRAVAQHDVSGYVAGTTQRQRAVLRSRLGVVVEPEDLDTLAGVARTHRQVDHDEVVRLRRANPDETLEQLARRLGCSLSTVKRHLRNDRRTPGTRSLGSRLMPTQDQVMAAFAQLDGRRSVREDVAA
jgi:AraC-like DNA-binding protein